MSGLALSTLRQREQAVGDDDAGNPSGMEGARRRAGEEEDVGQAADREILARDVPDQLVVLARVVADLVDHEPRAGPRLLGQLLVLGDHLTLVELVVGDHAAQEEVGLLEPFAGLGDVQSGVHVAVQLEQADRVDVEHGRRRPAVAVERVIARQAQHVVEALGGELPAAALERVAVPVLARQVDDHLLAAGEQVRAQRVGGEHGVATGVVGDRQYVDPRVGGQRPRLVDERTAALGRDHAPGGH